MLWAHRISSGSHLEIFQVNSLNFHQQRSVVFNALGPAKDQLSQNYKLLISLNAWLDVMMFPSFLSGPGGSVIPHR